MSTVSVIAETSYWKDNNSDSEEYTGRQEILDIMRDSDSEVIELGISPDAQSKTVDRFYIRIPAHVLMAALTNVLMNKEPET